MKAFLFFFCLAACALFYFTVTDPRFGHFALGYNTEIRDHQPAIGMSAEDLRSAMGEPIMTKRIEKSGAVEEQWFFPGRQITLKNAVVTQIETLALNASALATPEPRAASPRRVWGYDPAVGWVQHDADVSTQQSYGGGGYGGPLPTPVPTTSDVVRDKMGLQGTSLDQRPRR